MCPVSAVEICGSFCLGGKNRTDPLTDLFFCAAEAAAAAAAAISARGGALNAVRSLGSSTSGLGDTLALAAAMQAASVHEEKDHYEVDDTNDEVKESISDIDAFERRLESGDARDMVMKAAPSAAWTAGFSGQASISAQKGNEVRSRVHP